MSFHPFNKFTTERCLPALQFTATNAVRETWFARIWTEIKLTEDLVNTQADG